MAPDIGEWENACFLGSGSMTCTFQSLLARPVGFSGACVCCSLHFRSTPLPPVSASLTFFTMASEHPVPIPYGLSESHRQNRTMGKFTVLPVLCSRRKAASPQQRVTARIKLPIVDIRRNSDSRHQHRHKHSKLFVEPQDRSHQKLKMAVATPQSHKKRTLAANGRADRSAKPTSQARSMDTRRLFRRDQCGPGTRIGASKDKPIAIEDESSESEIDEGARKRPIPFRDSTTVPWPAPFSHGLYSRLTEKQGYTHRFGRKGGIFGPPTGALHESFPTVEDSIRSSAPSIYDE
jgi:hypothetical protein